MTKFIRTVQAIILFVLLLLILIFCFQNNAPVDITFLHLKVQQMPLFIALFGTLLVGLFLGFIAGLISGTKTKREALRTKKDVGENSTSPELNKPQEDK